MVKPKQRHFRGAPGKKQRTEPPYEEDWLVVKKQRITILIPPLPGKVLQSAGEMHLQEIPRETKSHLPRETNSKGESPSMLSASMQPGQESAKSITSSPEGAICPQKTSNPNLTFRKSSSMCNRTASRDAPLPSFRGCNNTIGRCSTSKTNKGMMIFADSSNFLNSRMRASCLDRKLRKAGGLEKWLISLGLTCFLQVFKMRRVNKFQLANITMEKLKDMGTIAVGPRRKLMHAINCICQPHCFQHM
ncbi:uncharacterized protein LOC127251931 [Andrographis paniculata]|uniref:uncharacterized protein LOC127251931 n=1 Tax=Andrographis paniculata TaxID=175694 RepID=UPI0021E8AA83|nr:uncharacterized protein LOC127251931 [Andrographis paniculata]XP_051131844.1 uncharacterized protein LOC127251931 [Andrographis paniculata]